YRLFRRAVRLQGERAVAAGHADATCVAVDKSLLAGQGPPWDARDRASGRRPPGVDPDTTWGYSGYDGWGQGYSFEVVVSATGGVPGPLLASADTASRSEQRSFRDKVPELPVTTRYVCADRGYDSNAVAEAVEWQGGRRTGRRFLCPEVPRPQNGKLRQPHNRETRTRQHHRRLRDERRRFFRSRRGGALYAPPNVRAEPFNAQLKHLFDLQDRVWHWGLDNNRTTLLAAICAYQLLLAHNHSNGRRTANLQCLLDAL